MSSRPTEEAKAREEALKAQTAKDEMLKRPKERQQKLQQAEAPVSLRLACELKHVESDGLISDDFRVKTKNFTAPHHN